MSFWDNSTEFGPVPGQKRSSWVTLSEEATANTKDTEDREQQTEASVSCMAPQRVIPVQQSKQDMDRVAPHHVMKFYLSETEEAYQL